jgi:hypothetical protein
MKKDLYPLIIWRIVRKLTLMSKFRRCPDIADVGYGVSGQQKKARLSVLSLLREQNSDYRPLPLLPLPSA